LAIDRLDVAARRKERRALGDPLNGCANDRGCLDSDISRFRSRPTGLSNRSDALTIRRPFISSQNEAAHLPVEGPTKFEPNEHDKSLAIRVQ
jgi:hypothetical protein